MYNFFRNWSLVGLSVYGAHLIFNDWTSAGIAGVMTSFGIILTSTLIGLHKHHKKYVTLRSKVNEIGDVGELDTFDDDGGHLDSLYKFLKANGAKLKDKKVYLGENRHMFERPYLFIGDVRNIIARVEEDIKWLLKVPKAKISNREEWLFTNDVIDSNKKQRYEFYLNNMIVCPERDELIKVYREMYPRSKLTIQTSEEVKQIELREEKLKNLPDHLSKDFLKDLKL